MIWWTGTPLLDHSMLKALLKAPRVRQSRNPWLPAWSMATPLCCHLDRHARIRCSTMAFASSHGSTHLAETSSEVKSGGSLVVPAHIAKWNRPPLDFGRLEHGFSQGWAGEAIGTFVRADPDKVTVPFDKDVLRGSAPPTFIFIHLAIARRNEPGNFFGSGGIGDIENADPCIEPGHRDDIWLGGAGLQPAMGVMRAEAPAREAEIRVGSIGRSRGARKEADNFWISRIFYIDDVRGMVILTAVGFHGLMRGDDDILQPRMGRVGSYGQAGVKRDGAEGIEFVLHMPIGLGVLDIG